MVDRFRVFLAFNSLVGIIASSRDRKFE